MEPLLALIGVSAMVLIFAGAISSVVDPTPVRLDGVPVGLILVIIGIVMNIAIIVAALQ